MKVLSSALLAQLSFTTTTTVLFFFLLSLFSSSSSSSLVAEAGRFGSGRLSQNHELDMGVLHEERRQEREFRRQRDATARSERMKASQSHSEAERSGSSSASNNNNNNDENSNNGIVEPVSMGRSRRGGWREELRRKEEHRATSKAASLARVHPMMAHMSTEARASHLLLSRLEDKFISQTAQARQLLQMLQDVNPHHRIAKRYAEKPTADPHEEAKKLKERETYDKVTEMEAVVSRLEYQLSEIKSYAEDTARDAASSRDSHRSLSDSYESQLDAEKQRCAEALAKQEERLVEAHADLNERNHELQQVRATLDSVSGVEGSAAAGWKLTLIQHAELVVGAFGIVLLVAFIAAYLCGRSRGRRQGLTMKRGGDDYLFDGRSAAAKTAANTAATNSTTSINSNNINNHKNDDYGSMNTNNNFQQQQGRAANNNIQGAVPQQQTNELRNRALHRFDGGV